LFCHQIIWNMKANCYKDDGGEVVRKAIGNQRHNSQMASLRKIP
jgi:hypothetical protein